MYTIKKFQKGDVITEYQTRLGTIKNYATGTCWAVVYENDKVLVSTHSLTGKKNLEVYPKKSTALQSAEYFNCMEAAKCTQ